VKYKILSKENGPQAVEAKAEYEKETKLMLDTLTEMTPDYDNKVQGDYSTYQEHS
jgi:hypothetical protein